MASALDWFKACAEALAENKWLVTSVLALLVSSGVITSQTFTIDEKKQELKQTRQQVANVAQAMHNPKSVNKTTVIYKNKKHSHPEIIKQCKTYTDNHIERSH